MSHTKWSVVKAKMQEYRTDIERLENEGGRIIMPTLRKNTERESDGFLFNYVGNNRISVHQIGGTHNLVEIFEAGKVMDTEQDFETEIAFWLYRANAI